MLEGQMFKPLRVRLTTVVLALVLVLGPLPVVAWVLVLA